MEEILYCMDDLGKVLPFAAGVIQSCNTAYEAVQVAKLAYDDKDSTSINPDLIRMTVYGVVGHAFRAMFDSVDRDEIEFMVQEYFQKEDQELWAKAYEDIKKFLNNYVPEDKRGY